MGKAYFKTPHFLFVFFLLFFNAGMSTAQLISKEVNVFLNPGPEEEDLNVFRQWMKWDDPGSMLMHFLTRETVKYYDDRSKEVARLETAEEWIARQNKVRKKLDEIIGGFPSGTPLNARITGVIKRDGFRIEKIVFESFPGFYVPGCLYVPEKTEGYWHPYEVDFSWGVGGALTSYDLPGLIAGLAPRKVALDGIRNEMLQPADDEVVRQELSYPFSVYSARGVPGNIMPGPSGEGDYLSVLRWCLQKD